MSSSQSHDLLDETMAEILPELSMEHDQVMNVENEEGGENNEIEIKMPFYPSGEARPRMTARMRTPQVRTVFTFSLDSQSNKRARTSSPESQMEVTSLHETGESSRDPPPHPIHEVGDDITPPPEGVVSLYEIGEPSHDPPPHSLDEVGDDMAPPLDIGVVEASVRHIEAIEEGNPLEGRVEMLEGRVEMLEGRILENDVTIYHIYELLGLAQDHMATQQERITTLEAGMEEARQQQLLAEWRSNALSQQVMLADVRANMAENRVIGAEVRLGEMEQRVGILEVQVHDLAVALNTRFG